MATIGEQFLYKKEMSIAKYLGKMKKMLIPADELFLTIFARAYEIHVGVIMRDYFWTTARQASLSDCQIILGYGGKCVYNRFSYPSIFDTVHDVLERPPSTPAPPEIVKEVADVLANLRYGIQGVPSGNENQGEDIVPSGNEKGVKEKTRCTKWKRKSKGNGVQSGNENQSVQSGNENQGE